MGRMHPFTLQAEAVGDDTDTAHGHGRSGYHGVQQESVDGIKDSCRDRNAYQVIDECPEQVLADGADGLSRQFDGIGYFSQVGRNDGHFGYIHGDVASFSHGDT